SKPDVSPIPRCTAGQGVRRGESGRAISAYAPERFGGPVGQPWNASRDGRPHCEDRDHVLVRSPGVGLCCRTSRRCGAGRLEAHRTGPPAGRGRTEARKRTAVGTAITATWRRTQVLARRVVSVEPAVSFCRPGKSKHHSGAAGSFAYLDVGARDGPAGPGRRTQTATQPSSGPRRLSRLR